MHNVIKCVLFMVVAATAGCSASIKTVQQSDPELTNNFAGKRIGVSVSHLQEGSDGKLAYDASVSVYEDNATTWMADNKINGKIVRVGEGSILGDDHQLIQFFDVLHEDEKADIAFSSDAIKKELLKNDIDCLLMYSSAVVEDAGPTSKTAVQALLLGGRLVTSALGGAAGAGPKWDNSTSTNPNDSIMRVMVYYTCGSAKPLYLGGVDAPRKMDPTSIACQSFIDSAAGKNKK